MNIISLRTYFDKLNMTTANSLSESVEDFVLA